MRISAITEAYSSELRKVDNSKKNTEKTERAKAPVTSDRSDISSDAQRLSETKAQSAAVLAQVNSQPDVRTEKVAEVKAKISNGYYNTDEFIDKLADKLMKEFGVA